MGSEIQGAKKHGDVRRDIVGKQMARKIKIEVNKHIARKRKKIREPICYKITCFFPNGCSDPIFLTAMDKAKAIRKAGYDGKGKVIALEISEEEFRMGCKKKTEKKGFQLMLL